MRTQKATTRNMLSCDLRTRTLVYLFAVFFLTEVTNTPRLLRQNAKRAAREARHEGVKPNFNLRYGRFVKLVRVALTTRKGEGSLRGAGRRIRCQIV